MNDDAFVKFSEVSKSYDGRTLSVQDFSLSVARGEFVTLLGPSGSGKTTCLKMLAGFEEPNSGEIWLNGRPVNQLKPWKRNIGVVFQHYALFPHMTIAENLAFPLRARRIAAKEIARSVLRALDMVQLQNFAARRPAQLSGGQQQRVAIARALVFEPDLVLMDEPLGALDRRLREEMQYEIRALQQRLGVTMIYVTHDQNEAMVLSDRVAVMEQGRISQVASPEALYEEPQRLFVANFIGENNQLEGRIVAYRPDECQVEVGGEIVRAFPVAVTANDVQTSVTIRPERVALNPAPGLYPNCFKAQVEDIIFMGDYLRIHATLLGQTQFIVKIPNIIGHGGILPGDTVTLGWLVTDCRALDVRVEEETK
ncbi:MAG: ABC transporter ATP-binding protein [Gammaproteobacteria bacterium]|nr:ABC transporter ATP-binding protein [Gammaproteobacteria bacterium]